MLWGSKSGQIPVTPNSVLFSLCGHSNTLELKSEPPGTALAPRGPVPGRPPPGQAHACRAPQKRVFCKEAELNPETRRGRNTFLPELGSFLPEIPAEEQRQGRKGTAQAPARRPGDQRHGSAPRAACESRPGLRVSTCRLHRDLSAPARRSWPPTHPRTAFTG